MKSRVLFENGHWVVCLVAKGTILTVQSKRTSKGISLRSNHPQFEDYVDAFSSQYDEDVFPAYCKALLGC